MNNNYENLNIDNAFLDYCFYTYSRNLKKLKQKEDSRHFETLEFKKLKSLFRLGYQKVGFTDCYNWYINTNIGILIHSNVQRITVQYKSEFFNSPILKENIKEVNIYHNKIKNILKGYPCTLTRFDIACNIPLCDLSILEQYGIREIKSAKRQVHKSGGFVTGISIGDREDKTVFLRIYDKRFKLTRNTIKRFGTDKFIRVEYEIGRKWIKDKNANNILEKYSKKTFANLINHLIYYRSLRTNMIINKNILSIGTLEEHKDKHPYTRETLKKQVLGTINNNFSEDEKKRIVYEIIKDFEKGI